MKRAIELRACLESADVVFASDCVRRIAPKLVLNGSNSPFNEQPAHGPRGQEDRRHAGDLLNRAGGSRHVCTHRGLLSTALIGSPDLKVFARFVQQPTNPPAPRVGVLLGCMILAEPACSDVQRIVSCEISSA